VVSKLEERTVGSEGNGKDWWGGIGGLVELRVFLLRKRSWRLVHIVLAVEVGWCADSRYWNRSPRMSSSSLSEEVVDRAICSRISWGRSLVVAEEEVMHLPVDASLL
jgi:hypothetical protein